MNYSVGVVKMLFILNEDCFFIFNFFTIEYDIREWIQKVDIFRVWE